MKLERIIHRALLSFTAAVALTAMSPATSQERMENAPPLPQRLAVNIHNCGDGCWQEEHERLEEAGPRLYGVRISPTHLHDPTTGALLPDRYLAWALDAYAPDRVIVTISGNNNLGPTSPALVLDSVQETLREHPRVTILQLINEPLNFHGITPQEYVWQYAGPVRNLLDKEINTPARTAAGLKPVELWSAPWFGKDSGVSQTRAMYDEAQNWSGRKRRRLFDRYTVHDYPQQGASLNHARTKVIDRLKECLNIVRDGSPVSITETGTDSHALHKEWFSVMVGMEAILDDRMHNIKGPEYVDPHPSVVFYDFREDMPEINGEYGLLRFDLSSRTLVPTSDAWTLLQPAPPTTARVRRFMQQGSR